MSEIKKQVLSWWQDGISFKETIALILIFIFGYAVYITCKKIMGIGLSSVDIEFFKILSTQMIIVLCFYFGGNSAENIIGYLFKTKNNKITTGNQEE